MKENDTFKRGRPSKREILVSEFNDLIRAFPYLSPDDVERVLRKRLIGGGRIAAATFSKFFPALKANIPEKETVFSKVLAFSQPSFLVAKTLDQAVSNLMGRALKRAIERDKNQIRILQQEVIKFPITGFKPEEEGFENEAPFSEEEQEAIKKLRILVLQLRSKKETLALLPG